MAKILYLDCHMGAAGDMLTAALLELSPNPDEFIEKINSFADYGLEGIRVERSPDLKCGISGTRFEVTVNGFSEESESENSDKINEDPEQSSDHREQIDIFSQDDDNYEFKFIRKDINDHAGDHGQKHEHMHEHTNLSDIENIIKNLPVSEKVKTDAISVYRILAEAEAIAHRCPVIDVHFHEVGTFDAIIDIVSFCMLIEDLAPEKIIASPISVGRGFVKCAHGLLPVPAPATALILRGIPHDTGNFEGELCTPTGAALLRYFVGGYGEYQNMPEISIWKIGYGMGKKNLPAANCVIAYWGEENNLREPLLEQILSDISEEYAGTEGGGIADVKDDKDDIDKQTDKDADVDNKSSDKLSGNELNQELSEDKSLNADNNAMFQNQVAELKCDIFDMSEKDAVSLCKMLIDNGALDAFTVSLIGQKSRPGFRITCVCSAVQSDKFTLLLLRYTTSFGLQKKVFENYVLRRKMPTVAGKEKLEYNGASPKTNSQITNIEKNQKSNTNENSLKI